ncbi:hypothetical protein KIW84_043700 [Lathyrus oleraceus]|uniref:Uncharacterized protein n=1 Tax=Pisum sativum TaxID=3888 RepID=A0A9D5AUW7_PEA|nr:hypothetical protein KIW84_043700 [Pisum sativum]
MLDEVMAIAANVGLLPLVDCSITMIDASLLSTSVERWNKETSSFYLLFDEMMITMDDVSIIFHLPFASNFFTTPFINIRRLCVDMAGDSYEEAIANLTKLLRVNTDFTDFATAKIKQLTTELVAAELEPFNPDERIRTGFNRFRNENFR